MDTFADLLAAPGVVEVAELRSRFGFLAFHGGLEAGTEGRSPEPLAQARHDAAADEDAAERAQRHRQVGCGAAQHAAEAFQHFQA